MVGAKAREYGKRVEEIRGRRKRGEESEARMVAIYLGRQLGGHKQGEIGKAAGLENVIGEFGLFTDEVESDTREKARPESTKD